MSSGRTGYGSSWPTPHAPSPGPPTPAARRPRTDTVVACSARDPVLPPRSPPCPRPGPTRARAAPDASGDPVTAPSTPATTTPVDRLPRADILVIALLLGSAFVVILNETTMSVALAPLMADLGITASTGQWLTTAFMLTMAVVIPATGFLLQRLGTRGAYLLAMSLFSAGTLLAAVSPGFAWLLVGRGVQASGSAVMMPLLMTRIMTLVPPSIRGKIMGNTSIVLAAAPSLAPPRSLPTLHSLTRLC